MTCWNPDDGWVEGGVCGGVREDVGGDGVYVEGDCVVVRHGGVDEV